MASKKSVSKTALKKAKAKVSLKKKKITHKKKAKKTTGKKTVSVKRTSAQKKRKTKVETPSLVGTMASYLIKPSTSGQNLSIKDFAGQRVILYFYPKDNTPGCTLEGQDFRRLHAEFTAHGAIILGVSRDSVKSHLGFKNKFDFSFELLSDEDEELCRAFHVIQKKSLYGREFMGIERSTFVIDKDGTILREWRKVQVSGHAEEVLEYIKSLS